MSDGGTAHGAIASDPETSTAGDDLPAGRARWKPVIMALVLVAVALGAIVVVALRPFDRPAPAGTASADTPPLLRDGGLTRPVPLPDMTLPSLAGFGPPGGRDFSELRGPALVNFWASWCVPCVEEMPALQRVADDLDVTVIGVDYIDQNDEAVELAERLGIDYELLRDDDGEFGQAVGLMGTPTTLLVDAQGMIVRR
ncbi:MAG TPA: TlpA disulfide reductase family protein, partial [Euzebyales bacterium]|nr:TlpA disulfide reductase family protein [Euzebyales bacterium]